MRSKDAGGVIGEVAARVIESRRRSSGVAWRPSLAEFVRAAWHQVIVRPLAWNWHHDIICAALERVTRGEIRNLMVAVPPSTTKTLLISVFWPAWQWTLDPSIQYIFGTYGSSLTLKSARQHRDICNSDWYTAKWPGGRIPYQNTHAAAWFENESKGFRFSGTVGGDVTGRHAMQIIGDDLNKAQDVYGPIDGVVRTFDASWDYWDAVLTTRAADPNTLARVLAGHRLHARDVGGRWIESCPDLHVIALPMRYDPDHPHLHPDDPRTEPGELLWPERFDEDTVREREARPSEFAAQYQQNPLPPGGVLLMDEYLSHRYTHLPSDIMQTIISGRAGAGQRWITAWDLTFKGKATSDLVVGQVWCAYQGAYYIVDSVRRRAGFLETKRMIRDLAARYPWCRRHIIEDAANAAAIADDLRGVPGLTLEPHGGGALSRTQQCEGIWASGAVRIPADAPWVGGAEGFVEEHLAYDGLGLRHDDQVSASSLALLFLGGSKQARWVHAMECARAN